MTMKHPARYLSLIVPFAIGCTAPALNEPADVAASAARPKITITFSGLIAFAKDSNGDTWALLVNGLNGRTFTSENGAETINVPPHVPFVAFYPPESDPNPTPNLGPWILDKEQLELNVKPEGTHSGASVLARIGEMKRLTPGIQVNGKLFDPAPPNLIVARMKLGHGTFMPHRADGNPAEFRKLFSSQTSNHVVQNPIVDVRYVIEADELKLERKNFDGSGIDFPNRRIIKDGWHIVVGNYPVGGGNLPRLGDSGPALDKVIDTHFAWFYDLAKDPPSDWNRFVPLFTRSQGPRAGSSPRCMNGGF